MNLNEIANYYSTKVEQFGATPQGVDWNGPEGQVLRFAQLCRIVDSTQPFSINDLGCGYGAFYGFLRQQYRSFSYSGFDISEEMIKVAQARCGEESDVRFVKAESPDQVADYSVASGIFNVRLNTDDAQWYTYIESSLEVLNRTSKKAFAFNCLTSYSDADKMRDYLYYTDPCKVFDLCKRRYSRNVTLLHDYDLFEFTVLVRKVL